MWILKKKKGTNEQNRNRSIEKKFILPKSKGEDGSIRSLGITYTLLHIK